METLFRVRKASRADMISWMALAELVKEGFPGYRSEEYEAILLKNIDRGSALCVKNDDEEIVGILLFSLKAQTLSYMAVHPEHRGKGIGSALVQHMIGLFPPDVDIWVSTFREDDPLGLAPRALYRTFGFVENELVMEFGYPNQRFVLRRSVKRNP